MSTAEGEAFKTAYDLAGQTVGGRLEEALAIGMFRERREVLVTAFMRAGAAVRVTASIGSPTGVPLRTIRPAGPSTSSAWAATKSASMHNHPAHHGATRPSPATSNLGLAPTPVRFARPQLR